MNCKVCGKQDGLGNFTVCYTGKDGDFDCDPLDRLKLEDIGNLRDIEHDDIDCLKTWQPTIEELRAYQEANS